MKDNEKEAIQCFFNAVEKLKECKIIRSETYLGNIAEFIVKDTNGVDLALSLRQEAYDGIYKTNKKVQVKSHFGKYGTNILFKYDKNEVNFDDLIVILGPHSNLKLIQNHEFETYIFEDFKKWVSCGDSGINYNKTNKTVSFAKEVLKKNIEIGSVAKFKNQTRPL